MAESKDSILNKAFELGKKYEAECTGCAQCVIAAIFEALGIWDESVFKAASGLADGLGLTKDGACGALVGASMVISYLFGRDHSDFKNPLKPFKSYELVKKLHSQFIEKYEICRCENLQISFTGRVYNLWEPDDIATAFAPEGLMDYCPDLVGNVAKLATKIILDEGFQPQ
ncbi:MAG: C-GCAxxG-C-C family protein [Candidatus Thorarchaeota archaeon]